MYCVKCKLKTESKNITEVTALNGRKMLKSICSICNCKKSSFTKSETKTGKGIGNTIIKTIVKLESFIYQLIKENMFKMDLLII